MAELNTALPASALSLARVLGQSQDCVKLLSNHGQVLWMNSNGLCAMEIDALGDVVGRTWAEMWPESGRETVLRSFDASIEDGLASFSGACPTAKGRARWWDVTVHPLNDIDGTAIGFLSISRDVTEREDQRVALETIVAEMRHRLKNSYSMVCSLMSGLAHGDAHLAAFSSDFQQRVFALAEAQSLFSSVNEKSRLDELLALLVAPFQQHEGVGIALRVAENIFITSRVADAVALTIGEFAVNSAKYGAVHYGGQIVLRASSEPDVIEITWDEISYAKVRATSREGGQGLRLIERMLEANSASLELDWKEDGLVARIKFPQN